MNWQQMAIYYKVQGFNCKQVAKKIEDEFGLSNMYHKVYRYLKKYIETAETVVKEEKRVAVQNQEPECHEGKWEGTEIIRFAIMGDTQIGSKYTQLTHLHNFYDLCAKQGI